MQPFSNIRVIDLTHVIAGPFCTYQLAVMGADVIKIEPLHMPDMVRYDGADRSQAERGMGSIYATQNANKRAVAIDLKTSAGQGLLKTLIKNADVLVENYRAGALGRLGLGYTDIKTVRENIIYCSITGFGQQGPLSDRTAYDNVIQAISGLMAATGFDSENPIKVGPPVLDYGTGIQAAFAIAAALFQRTQTGLGQRIDIAMMDAAIMLSSNNVTSFQASGISPAPTGNSSPDNAGYGCYPTRDGQIMIGAYTGEQLRRAWQVMGDPAYGEEVAEKKTYGHVDNIINNDRARITEVMLTATADEWEERFNANKVPAARVRGFAETYAHPQLANRSVLQQSELDGQSVNLPVAAFQYAENGPALHSPPPVFAQHTTEVLKEAGLDQFEIDVLIAEGVIQQNAQI